MILSFPSRIANYDRCCMPFAAYSMQYGNMQYAIIQTSTGPLTFSLCTNKTLLLVSMILHLPVFRIRKFFGLPDPDPLVRGPYPESDPSSHQAKIVRKNCVLLFVTFYDSLYLKNNVNVPLKSNKQKNLEKICFWKVTDEKSRIRNWIRIC